MKVYIEPAEQNDRAVKRVIGAFAKHSPKHIEFVRKPDKADMVIMQINGRLQRTRRKIEKLQRLGIKFCMIQYCLKSTMNKDVDDWLWLWEQAQLVWSYYDLKSIASKEGHEFWVRFYHAPLGVDSEVFQPQYKDILYTVLTTGKSYVAESVREVYHATQYLDLTMAHLGKDFGKPGVTYYDGIFDSRLVELYNSCLYVSGLRRNEGFELPAAEGLLCGARPILFDQPHYRDWYGGLAVYIPETERGQIIKDLVNVLSSTYKPVTRGEIYDAREIFDWKKIIEGFWYACEN